MSGLFADLVFDYTLRTVAMGSALLGLVTGTLGCFAVLRRQSLLGDAVAHAALPGIALAFLLTGSKAPMTLVLGAAAAGWIGTLLVMAVVQSTRIKTDSALGIVLSVFFGFGLVLLTYIQKLPDAGQAGLDSFLFGQAAALVQEDLLTMGLLGFGALITLLIFWKEFKLLCFDREFAATNGLPVRALDIVLTSLIVVAIVIGLQLVGVVLMSAMVVAPAAAARQWTQGLGRMVLVSALFGAAAGVSGAVLSSLSPRLPTGPIVVVCVSLIAAISLAAAPGRGLLWRAIRRRANRRRLRLEKVLIDLYELSRHHSDPHHGHPQASLEVMGGAWGGLENTLRELESRGLISRQSGGWALTSRGLREAGRMIQTGAEDFR